MRSTMLAAAILGAMMWAASLDKPTFIVWGEEFDRTPTVPPPRSSDAGIGPITFTTTSGTMTYTVTPPKGATNWTVTRN